MKNKFSSEIRAVANTEDLSKEVESILLDAADALEGKEKEVEFLKQKLAFADYNNQQLFESKQQLIKDCRIALLAAIFISASLTFLGCYFL